MAVDFPGVGSFRIEFGHMLRTLENRFEIAVDDEWNLELVLPMIEPHKSILFGNVYSHHFVVFPIFKVLVPGCFAVKSLNVVQAEVLSVPVATIATPE